MDLEPAFAGDLLRTDLLAHVPSQDLRPPAGQAVETRGLEIGQHVGDRHPLRVGEMRDLGSREGLDVHGRRHGADTGHHGPHGAVGQLGVLSPHDVDLGGPLRERLTGLGRHLVFGEGVGAGLAGTAGEGAEAAAVATHVGVVDVAVDDEVHVVLPARPSRGVGQSADAQQVGRPEEGKAVGAGETPALGYFLFNGGKRVEGHTGGHGRSLAYGRRGPGSAARRVATGPAGPRHRAPPGYTVA